MDWVGGTTDGSVDPIVSGNCVCTLTLTRWTPYSYDPLQPAVGHKSTESIESKSVYRHSFHSQWDQQTRPWFHQPNPWPWLVDTRRTIDPKLEVGKAEQKEICKQYERSIMRSKQPTIDLSEQKSRYTLSATQSKNRLQAVVSGCNFKCEDLHPKISRKPEVARIVTEPAERVGTGSTRSKSMAGGESRQSARKSFNEGVVDKIRQQLLSERKPQR